MKNKLSAVSVLTLTFASLIIVGCNKLTTFEKPKENVTQKKTEDRDTTNVVKPGDREFSGLLIKNDNASTFRDCMNPDSLYRVIDSTRSLEGMYRKIFSTENVYGSVMTKVKGRLIPTPEEKHQENYPRTLVVKEVASVEKKSFENLCVPFDYWAWGKDQGWTLEISEKENLIELIIPGENKSYYFFYAEPVESEGVTIYKNHNQIQRNSIEIKIRKETCRDSKGAVRDHSVEIDINGKVKLSGCGMKGIKE